MTHQLSPTVFELCLLLFALVNSYQHCYSFITSDTLSICIPTLWDEFDQNHSEVKLSDYVLFISLLCSQEYNIENNLLGASCHTGTEDTCMSARQLAVNCRFCGVLTCKAVSLCYFLLFVALSRRKCNRCTACCILTEMQLSEYRLRERRHSQNCKLHCITDWWLQFI